MTSLKLRNGNLISQSYLSVQLIFREYRKEDLESLAELEKRAFPIGPYTKNMLRRVFHRPDSTSIIAEEEGVIAGYVVSIPLDDMSCDIESIAVSPDFQRTGLGSQLISSIERKMREAGFKYSILEVRDKNTEAIAFYEKHGYVQISHMPTYYREIFRGSRGAYRMKKALF